MVHPSSHPTPRRATSAPGRRAIPPPGARYHAPEVAARAPAGRARFVDGEARPVRSTCDMRPWYTSKPCDPAAHSHLNVGVIDSTWGARVAYQLDRHPRVVAWAKHDHLGVEVPYLYKGARRKYRPDFFVRLA